MSCFQPVWWRASARSALPPTAVSIWLGGPRHDEPEEQRDEPGDGEVVKRSRPARKPVSSQPLHARAHRGRDDEREEEQGDQHLQLPEHEHTDDDADGDERGQGNAVAGAYAGWFSPFPRLRKLQETRLGR